MSSYYQRYIKLLEKWPIDKTKPGRDFGERIRQHLQVLANPSAVSTESTSDYYKKQLDSLERLVKNTYSEKYKRNFTSSATGLSAIQCKQVLSSEFLKFVNEEKVKLRLKSKNVTIPHIPVLSDTAIEYLLPGPNKTIIDMTFGAGGHSRKILEKFDNVKIYGLDCDPVSHGYAKKLALEYPGQIIPLLGKFSDLPFLLKAISEESISVDGILFDFGCSSMQFDDYERGFSLSKNGPLDMRMNPADTNQLTAAELLSKIDEDDLVKILKVYGEEKQAKKIARSIINARSLLVKLKTTHDLANIIDNCLNNNLHRVDKLQRPSHTATKTFQALRIFVNNELNEINFGMLLAQKLLKLNGRLVTITFHSLEDTIVKRHIQGFASEEENASPLPLKYSNHDFLNDEIFENTLKKNWFQLHKHVITPKDVEVNQNPRSRSAKLRALQRI